jgi:hypothetical protein
LPDRLEESDIVRMLRDRERQAEAHIGEWRKEAKENYDMVAGGGRQWDKEDRAKLEGENRPCVEFNRLGTIVDAVSGSEVNNRQEIRYVPRRPGAVQQAGMAEMRTAAAKWARDNCDAEDEESDAFLDVLIAGVGFTQTRMDYEEEEEGKIVIERGDPTEFSWDPSARKRNIADARWIHRKRGYSKDEIEARWPDKAEEIQFSMAKSEDADPTIVNPKTAYDDDESDQAGAAKSAEVIHAQWYEVEDVYRVLDPMSGQIVELDEDRFAMVQQMYPQAQYAKTPRRKYLQAFICGNVELESGPAPCQHGFTFQAITGKRDRNKGYWYGLVRPMKDPQRWANKFFSQILHIINTNAKGGILYESGATDNTRALESKWAKADSAIKLNPGGLQKIMPKPQSAIPPAIEHMMEFSIASIRDSSGVNLELLGMVDREQAGVLEAQRTRAGLTILAPFFDSLRYYRKRQGRVLAYFINEYISDGRLIRILGPEGEQFVPLMKSPEDLDYDIVVDAAPTSRDTKAQAWMALREILPMMGNMGVQLPPEIFDYLPSVPESLAGKLKEAYMNKLKQGQQPPPQFIADMANKNADTELKEAGAAEKYAKAGMAGVQALQALFGPQQQMPQPGMQQPGMPPGQPPMPMPPRMQ